MDWQDDADRKEETLAIIADLLGFSWTGELSIDVIAVCFPISVTSIVVFCFKNMYFCPKKCWNC